MRFKKRFVFIVNGGEKISPAEAGRFFSSELARCGDQQAKLKHFDVRRQEGVVKCHPKSLSKLKNAFSKAQVFEGKKLALRVRKVSASFALRKYSKETV
ncbi:MAG TPA: hypothetical protein VI875_01570 [Candidatus Norongarragalinales archaeon]|nr:hypothetical protein [Candidatus Norongarragalinales archaeon]